MITRIQASGYRCLANVDVRLNSYNVLVGPNASGKSTFLDVIGLLRDALRERDAIDAAIRQRADDVRQLVWMMEGDWFDLAIEAQLPERVQRATQEKDWDRVRYEVRVGAGDGKPIVVQEERLYGVKRGVEVPPADPSFDPSIPDPILTGRPRKTPGCEQIFYKKEEGPVHFWSETTRAEWPHRMGPEELALLRVPADERWFAASLWFKELIERRVHALQLDPVQMRKPCPPDAPRSFQTDGSNLPLLVRELRESEPQRAEWWVEHLKTVFAGLSNITVEERLSDRQLYLQAEFDSGLRVPSWLLSDGSLRLLALTLIAYLAPEDRIFIIEEPENGIHPPAIEAVVQSLTSVYEGQVFLATHSPLVVGLTDPENLLCFSQTPEGATQVTPGTEHPALREWRKEVALSDLFAAGVLG